MLKRKQRSAIIGTSSVAAYVAVPYYGLYSMSKVFLTYLIKVLQEESGDKIDCLSFNPGYVPSNMTKKSIKAKAMTALTVVQPERSVGKALNCLGREWITSGALRHDFMAW